MIIVNYVLFFFKQKTAYERRISDWSSDVCSSDLQKQCQNHYRKLSLLIYSVSARSTNCRIASALDNTGRRLVRQSSILASHSGEARIWNGCVFISVMRDL